MKWTVALLIVVGLAAALCAAVLTAGLRAGWKSSPTASAEQAQDVEILVAAHAIPAMTVVDGSAVARRTVKSSDMPEGAQTNLTNVIGKVLVAPVVEGQAFSARQFASNESGLNLASTLPQGFRAMSTMLNTESGIEDLLYPGCVVDVVASFRLPTIPGRPSGEIVSATLLQGVQVLAIGPRTIVNGDSNGNVADASGIDRKRQRMVTVMVDTKQAEALQLASAHGELTVTLRNPLDQSQEENSGVTLSDLSEEIAARLSAIDHVAAATPMFAPEFVDEGSGQEVRELETAAPALKQEPAPQAKAYWTTTVLRAGRSETQTFSN